MLKENNINNEYMIQFSSIGECLELYINNNYITTIIGYDYALTTSNIEFILCKFGKLTRINEDNYTLKTKYSIEELKEKLK